MTEKMTDMIHVIRDILKHSVIKLGLYLVLLVVLYNPALARHASVTAGFA